METCKTWIYSEEKRKETSSWYSYMGRQAIAGGNARNIRSVLRTAIQQSFPWLQTQQRMSHSVAGNSDMERNPLVHRGRYIQIFRYDWPRCSLENSWEKYPWWKVSSPYLQYAESRLFGWLEIQSDNQRNSTGRGYQPSTGKHLLEWIWPVDRKYANPPIYKG